jgi:hypothetical protein
MDDDYVAEVLAREARDSSQRYRTDGLSAYMPQRFVYTLNHIFLPYSSQTDLTSPSDLLSTHPNQIPDSSDI